MVTIAKPSQKANENARGKIPKLYEFPFDTIHKGQSFYVGMNEISTIAVMRTLACRYGKQLGRKFKVVAHHNDADELVQIEVFYQSDRGEKTNSVPTSNKPVSVGKADPRFDESGDLIGRWRGYDASPRAGMGPRLRPGAKSRSIYLPALCVDPASILEFAKIIAV